MFFTLRDIPNAVIKKEEFAHPSVVDVDQHAYKNGYNKAIDAQASVKLRLNREKLAKRLFYTDNQYPALTSDWETKKEMYYRYADAIIEKSKELIEVVR